MDAYRFSYPASRVIGGGEESHRWRLLTCRSGPSENAVRTEEHQHSTRECDSHSGVGVPAKKRHASFNRSLILGHMVYSCSGRWYPDSHKSHSAVRAEAGLTNLNTIFQLNNLALPRGRPAPDRALRSEASLVFSVWAQWLSTDEHCPGRSEAQVCPLLTTGNNEKFLRGHQRN